MKKCNIFANLPTILFVMILSISCHKETNDLIIENEVNETVSYYIDDIKVSSDEFVMGKSDMYYIEFHSQKTNLKSSSPIEYIERRAYTSEDDYINFGETYGLRFRESIEFGKIMSSFAEKTGVITEYEKTGDVPSWYYDREKAVYDSLFGVNEFKDATSLFVTLYEHHFVEGQGAGKSIIMPTTSFPFMPPGWNDRVSCVQFVGFIGGGIHIFDKTFFRSMIQSVIYWGLTHVNLPTYSNDKMSSSMRI